MSSHANAHTDAIPVDPISLFAVGDISCDVNGSIEFLQHTTTIDKPFFSWNPMTNEAVDDINEDGVAVMGVDILPVRNELHAQHSSTIFLF